MRVAPPVDHPVARRGFWAGAAAALAALSAATPLLWVADHLRVLHMAPAAVTATAVLAILVGGTAALIAWRCQALAVEQSLRWDGTGWQLRDRDGAIDLVSLARRIELGHAALLSARSSTGRTIWLPVQRRDAPAGWHGLRVAVAGQARADATRSVSPAEVEVAA